MRELADQRPPIRQEQRALTRGRLLEAAETVFARRGFHGASVQEIAREAGVTTGAVYSNFSGKEDLFLTLLEETIDADIREYSRLAAIGSTPAEQVRGGADRWMEILRERPAYFPLFIEFWSYVIRDPRLRARLAERFAALRTALGGLIAEGAAARGVTLPPELTDHLGTMIGALGNGLALEKLIDPTAVSDELFGDLLALIFRDFEARA
jgi:AcrR family transcriptional regulator